MRVHARLLDDLDRVCWRDDFPALAETVYTLRQQHPRLLKILDTGRVMVNEVGRIWVAKRWRNPRSPSNGRTALTP